ncbi:MAG: class I SAM-dependent methyltransferase [Oscillatoriales cyanobacterium]|nr:MAG: class I SAM-dependent methyltransferase [Oscillatoriales cyanobacterium]
MAQSTVNLPYFDLLLDFIDQSPTIKTAFNRHVHWGYWPNPQQARFTAEDFAIAAERLSREVYGAAAIANGQTIVDVGCGFGGTIASLNEHFADLKLTGVNIDPRQLDRAKEWVTPQNNNVINWVEANAIDLPFDDASVDIVLAVECIFHFPDRQQFLKEVRRVLKPGGQLAISDFLPSDILANIPLLKTSLADYSFYGGFDISCTINSYRDLAQKTGFCLALERDITGETLPTYDCLRQLGAELKQFEPSALFQTLALEFVSRLRLLNYWILKFDRW